LKVTEVPKILGYFLPRKNCYELILTNIDWVVLHSGRFFRKLIWSLWRQRCGMGGLSPVVGFEGTAF
jgi:hypothetical protein